MLGKREGTFYDRNFCIELGFCFLVVQSSVFAPDLVAFEGVVYSNVRGRTDC